ncbi:MAG: AAA family ATPase [Nanoarchaeota archaeon]|nr:AAA family ATPase [Nanoarchaeota archaeon]
MLIGVTGYLGAGKSEFSKILVEEYGFVKLAFGNEVRAEAERRLIKPTRNNLQNLGYIVRKEQGGDVWVRRLIEKIENGKDYVIEGIRNPEDVEALEKLEGFVLIGLNASFDVRCNRILSRKRGEDSQTKEEFVIADNKDRGKEGETEGQQSEFCFRKVSREILNEGSLNDLKEKARELLEGLNKTFN